MTNGNPFSNINNCVKHLKVVFWGDAGSGKTTLAHSFPKPLISFDLEKGSNWINENVKDADKIQRIQSNDFNEIGNALEYLITNFDEFKPKTIVVDPITVLYDAVQQKYLERKRIYRGNKFEALEMNDWGGIKKDYYEIVNKLINLPCHVIFTARAKDGLIVETDEDTGKMKVKGKTHMPSMEKNMIFIPDIGIELIVVQDENYPNNRRIDGIIRTAEAVDNAHKDRTGKLPNLIEDITYEKLVSYYK
jgi:hypothetical protein